MGVSRSARLSIGAALCVLALAACGGGGSSSLPRHGTGVQAPDAGARKPASISAYSAAVLADSPLVYYRMNETFGTTAYDSSGHGYNGTYGSSVTLGGTGLVPGDAAPAFPGGTSSSAKVLKSPTNAALGPTTGAMSVEFWVNVPSTVSGSLKLFSQPFQSGSGSLPVYVSLESGSPPFFTIEVNSSSGVVATYPAAVLGAKNHVVLSWTGTALTAYVNGVASSGGTGTSPILNVASPYTGFVVGGAVDAHTGFAGAVGEFALYTTALSSARVTAHYNAAAANADPTPPPATGYAGVVQADNPVVYYRMNETSGTTAVDSSGHGYNGTYGTSVTLGGTGLVPGDAAPTFPGGTTSSAKVLRSSTNAALGPSSGPLSVEFWVNVPSTVTGSQFLFSEPFQSGAGNLPVYVSLESGSPPFFEVVVNSSSGQLAAYPAVVLGAKNHVVLTWTGTALTAYVNGVASTGDTGTSPIVNYASPFTGFTAGGPTDAHTGFTGSLGELALYATALSSARVTAHYNAGVTQQGTVVWKTGGGATLGQYELPAASDGQCSGEAPVISGNNATFTSTRNTLTTYGYDGGTYNGASTCYRNQMDPIDASTGTNFMLAPGSHYTFTFQTVVTLNGNSVYQYASDGGLAVDLPAIVWQTHSYGGSGEPCDYLVLQNTYVGSVNGVTQYGTVSPGGQPVWNFATCEDSTATGYWSPDVIHDGQVDNWQFDITAQVQGTPGGNIVVRRNGTVVYNKPNHVCDSSTTQCWWNFGPYTFYFNSSEEPPTWNGAGITVRFNNMTLVKT